MTLIALGIRPYLSWAYSLENHRHNFPYSSARSNGSWDLMNSPRRISTIRFLLDNSCEVNTIFLHGNCPPAKWIYYASFPHCKALPSWTFLWQLRRLYPSWACLKILKYSGDNSYTHSLRHFFKYALVFEPLRLCALPAITVFLQFPQVINYEALFGLRTLCTAPVLNFHFHKNENNVIPPELSEIETLTPSTHSLGMISLHSLQENSCSDRETIETHSLLSQTLNS